MSRILESALDPQRRAEAEAADKTQRLKHYTELAEQAVAETLAARRPLNPGHVARWLTTLDHAALLREAQALAMEVALQAGYGHTPQSGCQIEMLTLGETEVPVEFEYSAGRPGRTYGPPEDCYEDEPEELNIIQVFVGGAWIDAYGNFDADVIERWEQDIRDRMEEARQRDADDAAESRRRDRMEAW